MAILTAGTEMERARRAHEQASLAVVLAARLVEASTRSTWARRRPGRGRVRGAL